MAVRASSTRESDDVSNQATITRDLFTSVVQQMKATAGGREQPLTSQCSYNLDCDSLGEVSLYKAAICLLEEVCLYV